MNDTLRHPELPSEATAQKAHYHYIGDDLSQWLAAHAESLNRDDADGDAIIPRLAQAGLFKVGVPLAAGGDGRDAGDAALAIAEVAEHSLAAAFVFWGQRTYIEYLLQSPNTGLAQRWLPKLLAGHYAGATGLSNAMKFLGGIEALQIAARPTADGWLLQGELPWVTNLRRAGFVTAAAVEVANGKPPMVVAFYSDQPGVVRSPDLDLIALRGSNTAALGLQDVHLAAADILHEDARLFLPAVRPAFLAMQCGMSIGLARASLQKAHTLTDARRGLIGPRIKDVLQELDATTARLLEGLRDDSFKTQVAPLFRLRIRLAEIAQQAVNLELQAKGGAAYLTQKQDGFARRWVELAFVPVITPSLTQLQAELAKYGQPAA